MPRPGGEVRDEKQRRPDVNMDSSINYTASTPNIDLTGGATRMLRTEKGRKRSVPPGLSPVPAAVAR